MIKHSSLLLVLEKLWIHNNWEILPDYQNIFIKLPTTMLSKVLPHYQPRSLYNSLIKFICTIHLYTSHVQITCTNHMYHSHVQLTCTIYMYNSKSQNTNVREINIWIEVSRNNCTKHSVNQSVLRHVQLQTKILLSLLMGHHQFTEKITKKSKNGLLPLLKGLKSAQERFSISLTVVYFGQFLV